MVMPRDHAKQRRAALNGFCWQLVRIFHKWCVINLWCHLFKVCGRIVRASAKAQNVSNYVNESAGHLACRGGKSWVTITNSQPPEHKGIWNGKL